MNVLNERMKINDSHLFAYDDGRFKERGASWVFEVVSAFRWAWEWNRVKFEEPTEWNFKRDGTDSVCMVIRDKEGRIIWLRRFYHAPDYFQGSVSFTLDHGVIR